MDVDNGTGGTVDYGQGGGGGAPLTGDCSGTLKPHGHAHFTPCGTPPWTVTFTDQKTGKSCTSSPFSDAGATVTIVRFNPCEITIT